MRATPGAACATARSPVASVALVTVSVPSTASSAARSATSAAVASMPPRQTFGTRPPTKAIAVACVRLVSVASSDAVPTVLRGSRRATTVGRASANIRRGACPVAVTPASCAVAANDVSVMTPSATLAPALMPVIAGKSVHCSSPSAIVNWPSMRGDSAGPVTASVASTPPFTAGTRMSSAVRIAAIRSARPDSVACRPRASPLVVSSPSIASATSASDAATSRIVTLRLVQSNDAGRSSLSGSSRHVPSKAWSAARPLTLSGSSSCPVAASVPVTRPVVPRASTARRSTRAASSAPLTSADASKAWGACCEAVTRPSAASAGAPSATIARRSASVTSAVMVPGRIASHCASSIRALMLPARSSTRPVTSNRPESRPATGYVMGSVTPAAPCGHEIGVTAHFSTMPLASRRSVTRSMRPVRSNVDPSRVNTQGVHVTMSPSHPTAPVARMGACPATIQASLVTCMSSRGSCGDPVHRPTAVNAPDGTRCRGRSNRRTVVSFDRALMTWSSAMVRARASMRPRSVADVSPSVARPSWRSTEKRPTAASACRSPVSPPCAVSVGTSTIASPTGSRTVPRSVASAVNAPPNSYGARSRSNTSNAWARSIACAALVADAVMAPAIDESANGAAGSAGRTPPISPSTATSPMVTPRSVAVHRAGSSVNETRPLVASGEASAFTSTMSDVTCGRRVVASGP